MALGDIEVISAIPHVIYADLGEAGGDVLQGAAPTLWGTVTGVAQLAPATLHDPHRRTRWQHAHTGSDPDHEI